MVYALSADKRTVIFSVVIKKGNSDWLREEKKSLAGCFARVLHLTKK